MPESPAPNQELNYPSAAPSHRDNVVHSGEVTHERAVFLIAFGIAGTTIVLVAGAIAGAIRGRGSSRSELAQLREQLRDHATALGDVQNSLVTQSSQLAELHERLDFAERLLTQGRDRTALKSENQ